MTTIDDIETLYYGKCIIYKKDLKALAIEQIKHEVMMGTSSIPKTKEEMEKWFRLNIFGLITKRWMDFFGLKESDILE